MKITKKEYTVSVKGSKNYQSISLTEGFEVNVDEDYSHIDFESEKQQIKDRLIDEAKDYLNEFVEQRELDDSINLDL